MGDHETWQPKFTHLDALNSWHNQPVAQPEGFRGSTTPNLGWKNCWQQVVYVKQGSGIVREFGILETHYEKFALYNFLIHIINHVTSSRIISFFSSSSRLFYNETSILSNAWLDN
jgi:hypothetical protein